jgi:hypothetical protein
MVAIETKYVGPRDRTGSRIIATTESGHRVVISYPQELSGEAAHRKAAVELCRRKLRGGNCDRLIGGGTKKGYVFVFAPESCKCGADAFRGFQRGRWG